MALAPQPLGSSNVHLTADYLFAPATNFQVAHVDPAVDLVTVSCTVQRLHDLGSYYTIQGSSAEIRTQITDEDRKKSESIRKYFESKLLLELLRADHPPSRFRKELAKVFNGEYISDYSHVPIPSYYADSGLVATDNKYIGMIYNLPKLYDYDMRLRELLGGDVVDFATKFNGSMEVELRLTYLGLVETALKGQTTVEYWFRDSNNNAVALKTESKNPLRSLWEKHLSAHNEITVSGTFSTVTRDQLNFYGSQFWNLV